MKDLLKRWAELEPTLCKFLKDDVALAINGEWVFIYTTPFYADMFIQYTVQQAIEARGLNWSIWFDYDDQAYDEQGFRGFGGSQHSASVFTDNERYAREGEISAAEALLSAYLQALEAKLTK